MIESTFTSGLKKVLITGAVTAGTGILFGLVSSAVQQMFGKSPNEKQVEAAKAVLLELLKDKQIKATLTKSMADSVIEKIKLEMPNAPTAEQFTAIFTSAVEDVKKEIQSNADKTNNLVNELGHHVTNCTKPLFEGPLAELHSNFANVLSSVKKSDKGTKNGTSARSTTLSMKGNSQDKINQTIPESTGIADGIKSAANGG